MEAPLSFVSKARTAFHSAAAKAERVFSDFKPDRGTTLFFFFSFNILHKFSFLFLLFINVYFALN